MKIINLLFPAALAASSLVITGCHSGGAYEPKNTTKYDLENRANFVDMDRGTQKSITCSGEQLKRLADGRLQVVAHVRNREERRIQVQISCDFKDAQGFSTGDSTPWQNLILTENEQEDVPFTSMNNLAQNFTIKVRQAR